MPTPSTWSSKQRWRCSRWEVRLLACKKGNTFVRSDKHSSTPWESVQGRNHICPPLTPFGHKTLHRERERDIKIEGEREKKKKERKRDIYIYRERDIEGACMTWSPPRQGFVGNLGRSSRAILACQCAGAFCSTLTGDPALGLFRKQVWHRPVTFLKWIGYGMYHGAKNKKKVGHYHQIFPIIYKINSGNN